MGIVLRCACDVPFVVAWFQEHCLPNYPVKVCANVERTIVHAVLLFWKAVLLSLPISPPSSRPLALMGSGCLVAFVLSIDLACHPERMLSTSIAKQCDPIIARSL